MPKAKTSKRKMIDEMAKSFKLLPDAKPPLFHGHTVRGNLPDSFWRGKIRPIVMEQFGRKCSVCGKQPEDKTKERYLHVHEVEEFDFDNIVCHLKELRLVCNNCHNFYSYGNTMGFPKDVFEKLKIHFLKVNNIPLEMLEDWDDIIAAAFQANENSNWLKQPHRDFRKMIMSVEDMNEAKSRVVRYTVSDNVPLAKEIKDKLAKKNLLFDDED